MPPHTSLKLMPTKYHGNVFDEKRFSFREAARVLSHQRSSKCNCIGACGSFVLRPSSSQPRQRPCTITSIFHPSPIPLSPGPPGGGVRRVVQPGPWTTGRKATSLEDAERHRSRTTVSSKLPGSSPHRLPHVLNRGMCRGRASPLDRCLRQHTPLLSVPSLRLIIQTPGGSEL